MPFVRVKNPKFSGADPGVFPGGVENFGVILYLNNFTHGLTITDEQC